MRSLVLNETYSRGEVHSIFAPQTTFTPQAGTWGLQEIVKIPSRANDYVFFVTYGQSQGEHSFDEGISEESVLRWQSQPSQNLHNKHIISFINHDETKDNIYLFLRENKGENYEYLGRLKYLSHDSTREKPVYFQWQLLDKDIELPVAEPSSAPLKLTSRKLSPINRNGKSTQSFRAVAGINYSERDAKNRELGLLGERLVLEYEKNKLFNAGRLDLADRVVHTSVVEGDGAGYDICSYEADGSEIHIEVKTTRGDLDVEFYLSSRELAYSEIYPDKFRLYRVFNASSKTRSPELFISERPLVEDFDLRPTEYKVSTKC